MAHTIVNLARHNRARLDFVAPFVLHWKKTCCRHEWDNDHRFTYIYIKIYTEAHKQRDKDVFPFHVQDKSICCSHDHFILSLIIGSHRLLSLLYSYCILHLSSLTRQLYSPLSFASSHPLLFPSSLLLSTHSVLLFFFFTLFLFFSYFLFPSRALMADSPPFPFMLNLFLSFIPRPSAFFSPLHSSLWRLPILCGKPVCLCVCRVHCQTSCLKTEGDQNRSV